MIYITGDTHGEVSRLTRFNQEYQPNADDYLIIAGDFGFIFGMGLRDEAALDQLAELPFTILFVDGNHECFPRIYEYPEEEWNGGHVHRVRDNILHLMRGQIFTIEGISIFTMGGGYSIDVMFRLPGRSWWPEEMPSNVEYMRALENLKDHDNHVDVIISHAAPESTMQMFEQTGIISKRFPQESRLNSFLEHVRQSVLHKHYYFGHMHLDKEISSAQTALYYDVYCLNTGEKVAPRSNQEQ